MKVKVTRLKVKVIHQSQGHSSVDRNHESNITVVENHCISEEIICRRSVVVEFLPARRWGGGKLDGCPATLHVFNQPMISRTYEEILILILY